MASDADAAGVFSAQGSVTVSNSVIRGNRAAAVRPNGRFAKGTGTYVSTSPFFVSAHAAGGDPHHDRKPGDGQHRGPVHRVPL